MKHIKKKDLETLQELLADERKKIIDHLVKVENDSNSELAQLSSDPVDIASVEISQSSMSKLGGRQRRLLAQIDAAIERMNDGSYGICELTGEPIPVKRLLARPMARYTVEAKEELERRERGFRDRDDLMEDDDILAEEDDD